jgi:predicted RNA-binding Zn-ribbon protein involved in translation (DUF1610 family)
LRYLILQEFPIIQRKLRDTVTVEAKRYVAGHARTIQEGDVIMIKSTHIKCDVCGWTQEIKPQEVLVWHNKLCPDCGIGIIVNDAEAAYFKKLLAISMFNDALVKAFKFFTGKDAKLTDVHLDSAFLRQGDGVSQTGPPCAQSKI